MKRFKLLRTISFIMILSLFVIGPYCISHAAVDDPGANRLSGDNIPAEFYDPPDNQKISLLARYGTFESVSPFTGKTYSHQDVFLNRSIANGIDVSQWQKTIDWQKVKAAGIDYAFIRVGFRGYGEAGTLNDDTHFESNIQNAIAAGLQVGVYIFSQAITETEAIEEADYILNRIGSYNVTMPLILDYEYAGSKLGRLYDAKLSKAAATKVCMAFCNRIASSGYTPMVYANKSMLTDQLNPQSFTDAGYRVWLAHYTTNTDYTGIFDFWQYSSTGKVDGINGDVDMDFYYVREGDNFVPNAIPIGSTVISPIPNQVYTGNNITPAVTLTYAGTPLVLDVDYTIKYENNKNYGTATITIVGQGAYCGSTQVTFDILPKTVSSVKSKKRSTNYITLKWAKNTKVDGYQIWRATSLTGTYKNIATIKSCSTTTYKNTGLTKGQCYYYKMRSYIKSGGKTYYSDYSPVATIYTDMGYTRNATAKNGTVLYNTDATTGEVVSTPAKNTSMSVTYSTKDDKGTTWYLVSYKANGTTYTGYVQSGKVTITMTGKVVNTKIVNVRKSNSTSSKLLTTLKKDKKVTVLKTKVKKGVTWYKVNFKQSGKTYDGWISAPYLKLV